ncbi:MAG: Mur ligase domain-containing protein, partial [Patescibacteria group bacterium]
MDFMKLKKIYCIGIGGIGVSAVARWARHNDIAISGSDLAATDLTHALVAEGIPVIIGHAPENVPADADLVVYTPAVDKNNVERKAAKKKGVKQVSYPEFLGLLSEKKFTIAVTGTHGKSTVTALIGLMLQEAGFDPTIFVGSLEPQLQHAN